MVTLIFLALFACLAVAIAARADMTMTMARNTVCRHQATALAETGLMLVQRHIGGMTVPATDNASDLHRAIADKLAESLQGTGMLDATDIHWDATRVLLPDILVARPDGRSGHLDVRILASGGADDNTTVTIESTGAFDTARRKAFYNMTVQRGRSVLMDYGIASKSAIDMSGEGSVVGANSPSEGSIMSATYSTDRAIRMVGNAHASGALAVVNPDGEVVMHGGATAGGDTRIGVDEPEWPEVDGSVFVPYVTSVYSGSGAGDMVLSNVRIPANTNPTFSGNVTVLGVMYVESPNKIHFSGNAALVGVIVCEEPSVDNLKSNEIKFSGNMSTAGVENLPALPAYDGLRELTGSFLLAPGFSAQFTGNFSTINGCMAASEFKFTGNAGGRVRGGIINLRDSSFVIAGNAPIIIDRQGMEEHPAGLTSSYRLVCVSGSYSE
jgi:hypothetical protein